MPSIRRLLAAICVGMANPALRHRERAFES
jgi:hypothetical protein